MIVLEQADIDFLIQLGLTKTQANVYLTLVKLGKATARMIFKNAQVPRPEVYNALDELQKMGLVEKEIATPYRFQTTPLELCIQILMAKREQQHKKFQEKAKFFLKKFQTPKKEYHENEYTLVMVEGIKRLEQIIKRQHQNAKEQIDILSTSARWLQILDFCFEEYLAALKRGVIYRALIEDSYEQITSKDNVQRLMSMPGFELKIGLKRLPTNVAIFDHSEAAINFFPSRSLKESPILITNHPSFIHMAQDHFDKVWKSARK